MSYLFDSIYSFLNELLPVEHIDSFTDLNKIIAYLLTLGILYSIGKLIYGIFKRK